MTTDLVLLMPNKLHNVYMIEPFTVVLADTENKTVQEVDPSTTRKVYPSKRGTQKDETLKTAAKNLKQMRKSLLKATQRKKGIESGHCGRNG